jgi:type II secretory pathway pseudopilin PulG
MKVKEILMGAGRMLYVRAQSGDTLVEVIVAMVLLGMVILGFVPLFIKIHTYELMNTARAVAYRLVESQIEAIKSTPYNQMGTQNGDPAGTFPQYQTNITFQNTPGIEYTILTQIRYKPDSSRGPNNPTTADYKDILVEVKAQPVNQVGGSSSLDYTPLAFYPDITMSTRATREDQWGEFPGGNIQVDAVDPYGNPVPNMTVTLSGSAGTSYQMVTDIAGGDMPGGVLFPNLTAGTYTMIATDTPGIGLATWMVAPGVATGIGGGGQTLAVTSYEPTQIMKFQAAPAYALTLTFNKNIGASTITLTGSSTGYSYSATGNGTNPVSIPGPIYPDTYSVQVATHITSPSPFYVTVGPASNLTQPVTLSS